MTDLLLTLDAFQELLDRLGGDVSGWPAAERTAALSLLENSPQAQEMLAHAGMLDAALAQAPKAPRGLADRIVNAALAKDGGRE